MKITDTNMEHYRNDILNITKDGNTFGVINGKPFSCDDYFCQRGCEFGKGGQCGFLRTIWMMEEYRPEIKLTAKEKHFVEFVEDGYLSRDSDGELCLHYYKPCKGENTWAFPHEDVTNDEFIILEELWYKGIFEFITWEDEEPWSIEELRKLKVQE